MCMLTRSKGYGQLGFTDLMKYLNPKVTTVRVKRRQGELHGLMEARAARLPAAIERDYKAVKNERLSPYYKDGRKPFTTFIIK